MNWNTKLSSTELHAEFDFFFVWMTQFSDEHG